MTLHPSVLPFGVSSRRLALLVASACVLATLTGELPRAKAVAAAPVPSDAAAAEQARALREFDRFLDHHPSIEDDLRLDPALSADSLYLEKNSELRDFLVSTPGVVAAVREHPRYYLFRALRREARMPLKSSEVARLSELLDRDRALERELTRHPEAIRDFSFLKLHPVLRDFLLQHPALGRVFLPSSQSAAAQH